MTLTDKQRWKMTLTDKQRWKMTLTDKQRWKMTLTDKQRLVLQEYVFDCCMSNMFGDDMEADYVRDGFPAFKGVANMADDELLEEAGLHGEPEEIQQFLIALEIPTEDELEDEEG